MNKLKQLSLIGVMLYPVYFIPLIIKLIGRNEKIGYFFLSFTMGCFAYLIIPYDTMDIVRYYDRFDLLSNIDVFSISGLDRQSSYVFDVYIWTLGFFKFPKEFLPFSIIFIIYNLVFLSYRRYCVFNKQRLSLNTILLGVIFLFLHIRFIESASGLRNMLAFSIFLYGFVLFITSPNILKRKVFFVLSAFFSILIHSSVLLLLIIYYLSNIKLNKYFYKILIFLSFVILFLGSEKIFFTFIDYLRPVLESLNLYFHSYFDKDGVWGVAFYEDKNIRTIFFEKYMKPIPFYVSMVFLMFKGNYKDRFFRFLAIMSVMMAVFSISRTMFDRFSIFFVLLFIYFLISYLLGMDNFSLRLKTYLLTFLSALILVNAGFLYKYRDIYWQSWHKLLYVPAPFLILNTVEPNQYIIRNEAR